MSEIYIIRHAESFANIGERTAFGNEESPLTPRGIGQTWELNARLRDEFGIVPEDYELPVLASKFLRPYETAEHTGFRFIDRNPILNESDVAADILAGVDVKLKHAQEGWIPEGDAERADRFLDQVKDGTLPYEIFFTHGMFTAAILMRCKARGIEVPVPFDKKRGYIPLQTGLVKLAV